MDETTEIAVPDDASASAEADVPVDEDRAECDQCGRVYTAPKGAFPSAQQKLATHRTRSHGGGGAKRRSHAVTDVAVKVSEAASKAPKAPTAAEWRSALGTLLSGVTSIPAGIAADTDPVIETMFAPADRPRLKKELEERLALSKADAEVVASPVARLIAGTSWNARSGRKVIQNADVFAAGTTLAALVIEWRRYFAERRQAIAALERRANGAPAPVVPIERRPQ